MKIRLELNYVLLSLKAFIVCFEKDNYLNIMFRVISLIAA